MEDGDFRFSFRIRVRWAEVDPQGVVFNGNYLTYFDVGMTEYWRAVGLTYPDLFLATGADTLVRKATIEFRGPARYDDEIDVCVRPYKLGNTSLTFALSIRRGENVLVTGEMVYVCVDPKTHTPTPIPETVRSRVEDYERGTAQAVPRS